MKLIGLFLFVMLAAASAAVPTLEGFESTQFDTNSNRIKYKADWTNDVGVVSLVTTNTGVVITNLTDYGTFSLPAKVTLLSLGTNQLDMTLKSTWLLNSPTNDASQVILSLSAGREQGQLAFITSQNGDGAFTLPDNSEQYDVPGALVDLQGNWIATTNRGIILQYTAPDWIEMARYDPSSPNGPFPGSTNGLLFDVFQGSGANFELLTTNSQVTFGGGAVDLELPTANAVYLLTLDFQSQDTGQFVQSFFLTNVTAGAIVPNTVLDPEPSGYWHPYSLSFIYTNPVANSHIQLWGSSGNPSCTNCSVNATNTQLAYINLNSGGGIGTNGGTVTSVSSGDLTNLFTVGVATPTTTPAISFTRVDPGADRIVVFDNTDDQFVQGAIGTGLLYDASTDTLSASTNFASITVTNNINIGSAPLTGTTPAINWNTEANKTWALSGNSIPTFTGTPTATNLARTIFVVVTNTTFTVDWPNEVFWPPFDTEVQPFTNSISTFSFTWDGLRVVGYGESINSFDTGVGITNILSVLSWNATAGSNVTFTTNAYGNVTIAATLSFVYPVACSDETTTITASTNKVTFRAPFAFTLTAVRASLTTAQASGSIFTVDFNEAGTSVLSTKLTIDNTEKTSVTAVAQPVISDSSIADDAELTIDVDQIGDGTATGLKFEFYGYQ